MNIELKRQRFREGLYQVFASEGHNKDHCKDLTAKFDKLTDGGMSGESAAGIIYAAYGANDAKTVCRTISEWVSGELEKFNAAHIGVHTDPKIRLKQLIQRMNSQIDKVAIIFNGQELTRGEVDQIRPKLPVCLNPTTTTYSATANTRAKAVELTLEVSE